MESEMNNDLREVMLILQEECAALMQAFFKAKR